MAKFGILRGGIDGFGGVAFKTVIITSAVEKICRKQQKSIYEITNPEITLCVSSMFLDHVSSTLILISLESIKFKTNREP